MLSIWAISGIAAVAVVAIAGLLAFYLRGATQRDREIFRQMEPVMQDLWRPMRHLADLRSVWPDLTEAQRTEIETSRVYKDGFHEKQVVAGVQQCLALARRIRSFKHWRLRAVIVQFLSDWERVEPDNLKIILAMVRRSGKG
jgi:hypothetical protein